MRDGCSGTAWRAAPADLLSSVSRRIISVRRLASTSSTPTTADFSKISSARLGLGVVEKLRNMGNVAGDGGRVDVEGNRTGQTGRAPAAEIDGPERPEGSLARTAGRRGGQARRPAAVRLAGSSPPLWPRRAAKRRARFRGLLAGGHAAGPSLGKNGVVDGWVGRPLLYGPSVRPNHHGADNVLFDRSIRPIRAIGSGDGVVGRSFTLKLLPGMMELLPELADSAWRERESPGNLAGGVADRQGLGDAAVPLGL